MYLDLEKPKQLIIWNGWNIIYTWRRDMRNMHDRSEASLPNIGDDDKGSSPNRGQTIG